MQEGWASAKGQAQRCFRFFLYAPATKPCSPAHIRDPDRCCCSHDLAPLASPWTTLELAPLSPVMIARQQYVRGGPRGFSCGSAIVGGVRKAAFSSASLSGGAGRCSSGGFSSRSLYNLGGTRDPISMAGPAGCRRGLQVALGLLEVCCWRFWLWVLRGFGGFGVFQWTRRQSWLPSLPCWRDSGGHHQPEPADPTPRGD